MRSDQNYKSLSLSSAEIRLFKIPDLQKGWIKRTEQMEIPNTLILTAINKVVDNINTSDIIKKKLSKIKEHVENLIKQEGGCCSFKDIGHEYFYIIENELKMIKVGISKTPHSRAKSLTTSSGISCSLISYYIGSRSARDVEKEILEKLKRFKSYGEWFKPNTVTVEMIERLLPEDYQRVT